MLSQGWENLKLSIEGVKVEFYRHNIEEQLRPE